MQFLIDTNILQENNLSLIEYLSLIEIYMIERDELIDFGRIPDVHQELQRKRFVKIIEDKCYLRDNATNIIDNLLFEEGIPISISNNKKTIKNKSTRLINKLIEQNIDTYRGKFKGLKPGSMGSPTAVKAKLARWLKANPEYTFDDILRAVDIYIKSLDGKYQYAQQADYFIYKKDGTEESSRLSAFIDEVAIDVDDGWTSELN